MATPTTTTATIEQHLPYVKYNGGLATALPVYIDSDLTVTGTTNIAGVSLTDLTVTGNTVIGNAATDTLAVTGVSTFTAGATTDAVNITGTAITTGKAIDIIDLAALTTGIGINVTSAATAITGAGRLIYSNHSGVTTTSGILNEFASSATDETLVVKVTSAGAVPLTIAQSGVVSTNFKLIADFGGINVYISDQTSPNGALTAPEGSICLNVSATGQIAYNNNGTTGWQIITSA